MPGYTGFSFKKDSVTGELRGQSGVVKLPSRVDVIKDVIESNIYSSEPQVIDDMFFNFKLEGCTLTLTEQQLKKEGELLETWNSVF
jgi:hypothetical protein